MKKISLRKCTVSTGITALLAAMFACSDSWLEPKPLSFYTPENAYVNAEGLYGALTSCERNMRHEFSAMRLPL